MTIYKFKCIKFIIVNWHFFNAYFLDDFLDVSNSDNSNHTKSLCKIISYTQSFGFKKYSVNFSSSEFFSGVKLYFHSTCGGSDIKIDSVRTFICKPNNVPRSSTKLNS